MVGVRLDYVEDVGGLLEVEEVAVEVGAAGEEGVEVKVEGPLVGDALVEEAGHGADVGEGPDVGESLGGAEVDGGRGQRVLRRLLERGEG